MVSVILRNSMLFAGIDVGVKNLCWCIIDTEVWKQYQKEPENRNPGIVAWKNVNLIESKYCEGCYKSGAKKGEICGRLASFYSGKKEHFWCGTHKVEESKKYKQLNSKSKPVGEILKIAFELLDQEPLFANVTSIAIELQLKKNPTMKRMSNALEAYFILRYKMCENPILKTVKYSTARGKLKVYKGDPIFSPKKGYAGIKDTAMLHTCKMLENCDILEELYKPHKKKDDLADSFLHCVGSIK
jgi:hypothetical protein